jgi:vancomycin resistance protein VanJ
VLNAVGVGGADAAADFRVATFNLTNGRPVDSLARLVAAHEPDILLLQEVTSSREELAALVPDYPYASMGPGVRGPGNDGYAILSRYPITAVRPVTDLPREARPADLVTVDIDGRQVTFLSIHLASPCIGCPADTSYPGGGTASAARMRVAEAQRYAEVVTDALRNGETVVVGGDLNSSPLNRPLHEFTAVGLTDAQRDVGTRPGLTRGPGPGVARVDVVLVAGLTPVTVVEGSRGHSTHSPVIADLAWPSPTSHGRRRPRMAVADR